MMITNIIEYFMKEEKDLFEAMKQCDHGHDGKKNPYHLEGSVWNHTEMVMDNLHFETDSTLLVAALLHDIGKPFVREVKDDRVWFKQHPSRGVFEAIDIVKNIKNNLDGFDDINVEYVLNLINLHHLFFNHLQNFTPKTVQKLYNKLMGFDVEFLDLLHKLCSADCRGRLTKKGYDSYHQFKYLFYSVYIKYFNNENKINTNTKNNEVIFNVGIPYSGKSYNINKNDHYTIISRDDLITEKFKQYPYHEAWKLVDHNTINEELENNLKTAINNKEDIIIDMTNLSKKSRNSKRNIFPSTYKKTANVFYTGLSEIHKRRKSRVNKYIAWDVVEKMMNSFSAPLYDEFDEINFIVH